MYFYDWYIWCVALNHSVGRRSAGWLIPFTEANSFLYFNAAVYLEPLVCLSNTNAIFNAFPVHRCIQVRTYRLNKCEQWEGEERMFVTYLYMTTMSCGDQYVLSVTSGSMIAIILSVLNAIIFNSSYPTPKYPGPDLWKVFFAIRPDRKEEFNLMHPHSERGAAMFRGPSSGKSWALPCDKTFTVLEIPRESAAMPFHARWFHRKIDSVCDVPIFS